MDKQHESYISSDAWGIQNSWPSCEAVLCPVLSWHQELLGPYGKFPGSSALWEGNKASCWWFCLWFSVDGALCRRGPSTAVSGPHVKRKQSSGNFPSWQEFVRAPCLTFTCCTSILKAYSLTTLTIPQDADLLVQGKQPRNLFLSLFLCTKCYKHLGFYLPSACLDCL